MCKLSRFLTVVIILVFFSSCRDEIKNYDKAPDWLKGNAWNYLEKDGDYSYFLKAAEMTGFADVLDGNGLITVFAPDDNAFKEWFTKVGISSLEEVDLKELELIVGFHLVEQAFTTTQFLDFQMEIPAGGQTTNPGMAHKYKSYSKAEPKEMFNSLNQQYIKVYQHPKYLPVISSRMFETQQCENPEATYRLFFPDINWQGADDKLYVMNAYVKEAGVPTDNGYVNKIDKVVIPPPSLYEALQTPKTEQFSTFLNLFDKFQNFVLDQTVTDRYAPPGQKYYILYHNQSPTTAIDIPNLASNLSYHGQEDAARPYYIRYSRDCYNVFAFDNETFDNFFRDFYAGYLDIEDLPHIAVYYLLQAHTDDHQQMKLPDYITNVGLTGAFGEEWDATVNDITYYEFCANGLLYGINQILMPLVFEIVTKPLFQYPRYSILAHMYYQCSAYSTLVDTEEDLYTLFIQNDETLNEKAEFRLNYNNPIFGDEAVQKLGSNGSYSNVSTANLTEFIESHVVNGAIRDFSERKYFATKYPFTYMYVENDTVYDEMGKPINILSEPIETLNGVTYEIDNVFEKNETKLSELIVGEINYNDFYQLMQKAGLVEISGNTAKIPFLEKDRYMAFIPKNGSWKDDVATLDSIELRSVLLYHFVPVDENKLSAYILPQLGEEGEFVTMQENPELSTPARPSYNPIWINFLDNKSLKITDQTGNTVNTDGGVPVFLTDGLVYNIPHLVSIE